QWHRRLRTLIPKLSVQLTEIEPTLYRITQPFNASSPCRNQNDVVCADDADITISSSDGVTFKVHRKHLEVHSDVFADAANATRPDNAGGEIVKLSETSAFPVFAGLAEAAEKYVVYSALPAVATQMSASVIQYPLQVLDYAARHNHKELANEAARLSIAVVFYDQWHINARTLLSHLIEVYHGNSVHRAVLVKCFEDPIQCIANREALEDMICYVSARPTRAAALKCLCEDGFMT
ncbi:hypothetical protein B0H14DRAFT_2824190, partial [Mycena olivaceomarginata]